MSPRQTTEQGARSGDRPHGQTPQGTQGLPTYADPQGFYSLALMPPFTFQDMTYHVFPLRSDVSRQQSFADEYLDEVPPEVGRFRAFLPYCWLMVVNYGRLSLAASNLGWISQRELLFIFPLEWYTVKNGRWTFQDWVFLTPYVFVDNTMSQSLGRTVIGWPKVLGAFNTVPSTWLQDPRDPAVVAELSSMVIPRTYVGDRAVERPVLRISHDGPSRPLQWPPDTTTPWAPWEVARHAASSMTGFYTAWADWLAGLGGLGNSWNSTDSWIARAARMGEMADPFHPRMFSSTINLKQFHDAGDPSRYCYQALTLASMNPLRFGAAGLFGDDRLLAGDASGGYRVRLYEWPGLEVASTLGLTVERSWRGQDSNVVEMAPVLPFWCVVDMKYNVGRNLAWRSFDGIWRGAGDDTTRDPDRRPATPRRSAGEGQNPGSVRRVSESRWAFNSTLGIYGNAIRGPFSLRSGHLRILPLPARRDRLQRLLGRYLNQPLEGHYRFALGTPPGESPSDDPTAYVFLVVLQFADSISLSNNIANLGHRRVDFLLPVTVEDAATGEESRGLVPVFSFAPSDDEVIWLSEVLGIPARRTTFSDTGAWTSPHPSTPVRLLDLHTEILPSLHLGQKGEVRTVVSIRQHRTAAHVAPLAVDSAAAIEATQAFFPAAQQELVTLFTLKQFRDIARPKRACYQSLVRVPVRVDDDVSTTSGENSVEVLLHEYGSLPIVSTLGLDAEIVPGGRGGVPYRVMTHYSERRVRMDHVESEELLYRTDAGWQRLQEGS